MDHTSRQPAHCRQFLCARDGTIRFHAIGDFLTHRNDVTNLAGVVGPHWNLADDPMPDVAFWRGSLLVDAFDLTALKHAGKLLFQHVTWLTSQDIENVLAEHRATRNTELAKFAIAVPRHHSILSIDRVKRKRQAIDDRFDESFLRFALGGSLFNFPCQTDRRVASRLIQRTDVGRERSLLRRGI